MDMIRLKRHPENGVQVTVIDKEGEKPLKHICRHSPDGFEYGYGGSGPSDLSLSICTMFGKPELYRAFTHKVIAQLDSAANYDIPFQDVKDILEKLENDKSI